MNERLSSMIKVLTIVTTLLLSACGGPAKVVTQDESADYKSATTLPPLKKPSNEQSRSSVLSQTESPSSESFSAPQVVKPAESAIVEESGLAPAYQTSSEPLENSGVRAEVISPNASVSRLQLSAPFDESWSYMAASLLKSDITVHTRNKVAGRFAIGCGDIASASEASRKGGWSFFDKKRVTSEYCSLQLISSKKNTIVSVINQSGAEVESAAASLLFSRLLNN